MTLQDNYVAAGSPMTETQVLPDDEIVQDVPVEEEDERLVAVLAEYDTVDGVFAAAKAVRDRGITRFDVHSPFPLHGIDDVIGIRPTILPWFVLGAGLAGLVGGLFLTTWTMGAFGEYGDLGALSPYEFLISGKPLNSLPAFVPVIFETTILLAAFTAGLGMLLLNGLPMLYNPLLKNKRFRRATDDRFFVVVDANDPKFAEASAVLRGTGPIAVEEVRD